MSRCSRSPESPLVEHQGVLEVAEVVESVRLDVEGEGVLGVVREHGVHILQGLQRPGQPHLQSPVSGEASTSTTAAYDPSVSTFTEKVPTCAFSWFTY